MKSSPRSSTRITKQDLLLEGWHSIYTGEQQFWAHPEISTNLIRFNMAAKLEKAFRELRRRASNESKVGKF